MHPIMRSPESQLLSNPLTLLFYQNTAIHPATYASDIHGLFKCIQR
jgi:hypothetical protein